MEKLHGAQVTREAIVNAISVPVRRLSLEEEEEEKGEKIWCVGGMQKVARPPPPPRLHHSERELHRIERERERERQREKMEREERERERALPGTLEVNVLRMVGRCLVCSRLISTWVSSLEPPPSTPSTVLHLHTHSHTPSTRTDRAALPPSVFNATDIKRLVCSCTAQSSCPFHMSHLLASSSPPPFADPTRSRTLRRSVSSILPLTRPTFHARLARSSNP